jgi:O-antigen ligase
MAENTQGYLFPRARLPFLGAPLQAPKAALVLGSLGAGLAALFISAHWSIALAGGAAVLLLSAVESERFLLLVIFLMPVEWMVPNAVPVRDMYVLLHALVIMGFFVGQLLRGRARIGHLFRPVLSRASLLFLSVALASTIFAKGELSRESARADFDLVAYVGSYFVVVAWVDSRERIRKVLWTLLFSTIVTAVFAFYQVAVGGFTSLSLYLSPPDYSLAEWEGRASSFLGAPNSLAGYLNLILPFALAVFLRGQGRWKKLGGWTFALGFAALLSTQSIGGLMGFLAILVLAIFYFVPSLQKRLAFLASTCVLVYLSYLLRNVLNPVHSEGYVGSDAVSRLLLWGEAWNLFIHSPVIGVGWGDFTNLYDVPLVPGAAAAHNLYLQLLSETGLMGFLAFFYLVVQSWRQARNQWQCSVDFLDSVLGFGILGALLSVLVHGFVDFLFQISTQFGVLFWTLLALLVASDRIQRRSVAYEMQLSGSQP